MDNKTKKKGDKLNRDKKKIKHKEEQVEKEEKQPEKHISLVPSQSIALKRLYPFLHSHRYKPGQCINAAQYCSTLDHLRDEICRKRPGLLRKGLVLQDDKSYTAMAAALLWEILPHSAHSPDLALSDFPLFGPLKRHLGDMAFETKRDHVGELKNWFAHLDLDFFRGGIYSLLSLWNKCIDIHGDYWYLKK
ncbi:transposase [Elysia marginata]|uniref:Transposase n=1 Tax=Elysia marginata TaxID=1093978 RepID=A0AAV4GDZ5_9GAST|nr:transposase [Elysia marginata]